MLLSWFPMIKFTFKGNAVAGLKAGVEDAVRSWTDEEIHLADSSRSGIQKCLPPSDHIEEEGYKRAMECIKKHKCGDAGDMIESFAKPGANEVCISVFKTAVIFVCKGAPELLKNALPSTYY